MAEQEDNSMHTPQAFLRHVDTYSNLSPDDKWYAMYWVRQFLCLQPVWEQDREVALDSFFKLLENTKKAWVVQKAQTAIKLYVAFVDGARKARTSATPSLAGRDPVWIRRAGEYTKKVRELIRLKHRSVKTEKAYLAWTNRFLEFFERRYVADTGPGTPIKPDHLRAYLSFLAIEKKISASTQEQALNALLHLFRTG